METAEERSSEVEERPSVEVEEVRPSTPENNGEVEERGVRFTPGQQDPAMVSLNFILYTCMSRNYSRLLAVLNTCVLCLPSNDAVCNYSSPSPRPC